MDIETYASWAADVAGIPEGGTMDKERLSYLGLGLNGEAGEVAEHIKKLLRDGAWRPDAVADELGDIAFYWAALCAAVGRSPGEVLAASHAKIEARITGA